MPIPPVRRGSAALRPAAAILSLGLLAAACAPTTDGPVAPGLVPDGAPRRQTSALPPVRISEFHYDNVGTDVNERIEISGPAGTDLTGWTVVLYNGSGGGSYNATGSSGPITLGGALPATCGARGVVVVNAPGLQNGSPDGIALVNAQGQVVEFLSYEGAFAATNGPANGMTSVDVGAAQAGDANDPADGSLQRNGAGIWTRTTVNSFGSCNDADDVPPPVVASVVVAPTTAALTVGATQQFTATARDAQGSTIPGAAITWSIAPSTVASVSATGLVTGLAAGTAQVTATSGAASASAEVVVSAPSGGDASNVRITELHYDNDGTDAGEAIELEGDAGGSLDGWRIELYTGSTGAMYGTRTLSGVIPASCGSRGVVTVTYPVNGLQNGGQSASEPDGIALVNAAGAVVEFISYEGTFVATGGAANGLTSTDIGVDEDPAPPTGQSLQRAGNGVWFGPATATFGNCNPAEPPAAPTGIVLEGYSFRGTAPIPVGFGELYRVKDVGTGAFVRGGLTWSTSDASVASVDTLGNVTATGVGTAQITVLQTATGRTASTTVNTAVFSYSDLSVYADELQFGTPTDATPADDYLVNRPTFAASWNATRGQPNWVAYNLEATHRENLADRCDCFIADPLLPSSFPVITTADYDGSNYSRGHMTMSADRTRGALDNATTFYYTNIIPQTSANNGGPWLQLEQYLGNLAATGTREIFVFAGGAAYSGTLNDAGRVAIPTRTWKVAVILPRDRGVADVTSLGDVEIIAVDMPNTTTVPSANWQDYRTTVDAIEQLTGYDLLSALPDAIENALEAKAPTVRLVDMDVQPGQVSVSTTAAVNVAILSSATFDAQSVVAADVRMVTASGQEVAPSARNGVVTTSVRDMNGDGRPDRIVGFSVSALRAAGFGVATPALMLRPTSGAWQAYDVTPPTVVK